MLKKVFAFIGVFVLVPPAVAVNPVIPGFIVPAAIGQIKNAQKDFLTRWNSDLKGMGDSFNRNQSPDTLTKTVLTSSEALMKRMDLVKNGPNDKGSEAEFEELKLIPALEGKLLQLKLNLEKNGAEVSKLTLKRAFELLKLKPEMLTPEEKSQLLTLLQFHIENKDKENGGTPAKNLLVRQLKALGQSLPADAKVEIPDAIKTALGFDAKVTEAPLKEILEKLADKDPKRADALKEKTTDLLKWTANLSRQMSSNPEKIGDAQLPVAELLFNLNGGRSLFAKGFDEATKDLRKMLAQEYRVDEIAGRR